MHPLILSLLLTCLTLVPHSTSLPHHHPPPLSTSLSRATTTSHAPPLQLQSPAVFFQVTHPIPHPLTTPCTHHILSHDFGYTYARPPVLAHYAPPVHCPSAEFSTIILEWSATCQGRQFDRIFGVWLGGVELLRSCTAEPTRGGIFWKVQKDVTRYYSLLMSSNSTLEIYLGNLVDKTYTGVYHVNVTFYFYPRVNFDQARDSSNFYEKSYYGNKKNHVLGRDHSHVSQISELYRNWADLILPISRNLPLNDGLWFEIENSTDFQYKEVVIPKNVYRAVLEVYVSYHENDEFWYSNLPNDYLIANNLTGNSPGNGAFREVLVSLDGDLVGAIWPFTVIYTGGINPLLWRPITAIGSYDLPTYDIEITPFLGKLLDGKVHKIGFRVTNALNVWYVDANLHLWVDKSVTSTKGELLEKIAEPLKSSYRSDFRGLDGQFYTGASRSIVSTGWVESSYGNITTMSIQRFGFENHMVLGNDGNLQTVNQTIEFNTSVSAINPSSAPLYTVESHKRFPLFLYTNEDDQGNSSYTYQSNVTLGFNEDKILAVDTEVSSSLLRNFQKAEGYMRVKNNLVQSGLGSTHQIYNYEESRGGLCYLRNVSSYNYTILYDKVNEECKSDSLNYASNLVNLVTLL